MKKICLIPALLLALAVALTGCKQVEPPISTPSPTPPSPSPSATPAPTPAATPGTAAPLTWGDQTFTRSFNAGDGTLVMQVTYTLPLAQNAEQNPAAKAINAWYKQLGADLLATAEENYEMVVAGYDVSKATGLPFQPTLEEMTFEITAAAPCVSIRREYYVNSGAPSPVVFRFSEQFDPATGTQLRFADFFADGDAMVDQVTEAFLAQSDIAQALQSGALTADQVAVALQPENFYFSDGGYVFWIQAGDLPATHSYIEVTIPYAGG